MKRFFLIILATLMVFSCSCQKTPGGNDVSSEPETVKQPEPQYMAYHFSDASRLGDDIYFVSGPSFGKAQIFATEYGAENFEPFIPCFDAVCNHYDRTKCCIAVGTLSHYTDKISAFMYDGEISLVLFSDYDVSLSMPYLNEKLNLVSEDIVNISSLREPSEVTEYLEALRSTPRKSNPLVYKDYFYYSEINNGTRTQYRIPLTGGEPERVFEEDDIIVKTIINDKYFGIRYEKDEEDKTQMYYFRSDMNYENVELLPEILDLFSLPTKQNLRLMSKVLFDADADYLYVLDDMKVWKIPDSDIHAEPILMSDMTEKLPTDLDKKAWDSLWYNDGVIYVVINTGIYDRYLKGNLVTATQWYEKSMLYSFDIGTGECRYWDISSQNYLLSYILYADSEYVYGKIQYAHDDGRGKSVTMRLTLDTMRYEVILPDGFLEDSAETTAN
ncbi:MAG: hypothetical protein IJY97_10285 [Clostridia bacterium]|nr:hypothetical protein [Clostridia bacterium]